MADVQVQTSHVENEYKKELSTVWNNLKRINQKLMTVIKLLPLVTLILLQLTPFFSEVKVFRSIRISSVCYVLFLSTIYQQILFFQVMSDNFFLMQLFLIDFSSFYFAECLNPQVVEAVTFLAEVYHQHRVRCATTWHQLFLLHPTIRKMEMEMVSNIVETIHK